MADSLFKIAYEPVGELVVKGIDESGSIAEN